MELPLAKGRRRDSKRNSLYRVIRKNKINIMSLQANNNKRIAKNTLLLYFRMLFMMVVSLYTSRVILNALGVENFGIYNVVGGVAMKYLLV